MDKSQTVSPQVTPKCCGSLTMEADILVTGESGTVEAPSIVYLIDADEVILVDTSFGNPELMAERHPEFRCHRTTDQQLESAIQSEGYACSDIDSVVFTHLDWDHCYNLSLFDEDTKFYIQRQELAYAISPYPIHAARYEAKSLGLTPPWLSYDLVPLDGETQLCDGVVAFPTPGHTVGHQSLAVTSPAGTTIVAGDAIPTFQNISDDTDTPQRCGLAMNEIQWWESANEILTRGSKILPGHEWDIVEADAAGRFD